MYIYVYIFAGPLGPGRVRIVLVITYYVISYHLFLISGNVITSLGGGENRSHGVCQKVHGVFWRFGRLMSLLRGPSGALVAPHVANLWLM